MRNVRVANAFSRVSVGCSVLVMALATGLAQQQTGAAPQSKPLPMPQDRVADSYEIYSQLLPGNVIEWGDAPRSQWLVEDTTTALPLDLWCVPPSVEPRWKRRSWSDHGPILNPHDYVEPPRERQHQVDFAEVLADYDAHCHDRYQLDGSKFRLELPVRLLDEDARKRYRSGVSGFHPPRENIMQAPPTPDEFKGAAGMHSFTAVYFNRAHTLAMTQIGMYCGSTCGNWGMAILEKKNGKWEIVWSSAPIIS
jgi:hypothetical protein